MVENISEIIEELKHIDSSILKELKPMLDMGIGTSYFYERKAALIKARDEVQHSITTLLTVTQELK